jgi:hypothetical protein
MQIHTNWNGRGWAVWDDNGKLFDISPEDGRAIGLKEDAETGELSFKCTKKYSHPHPVILRQIFGSRPPVKQ